jgi:cell division transport system permease protein
LKSTHRPEFLAEIAKDLAEVSIVEEVNYQELIVEKLVTLTTILRRVAIGIFLFLIFISMTVLLTTTAFKISIKREEIEVLQLIGASKWYVRKPFILEGLLFGITSGTVAFLLYYGILLYIQPFLSSYLAGIPRLAFFSFSWMNLYVFPPSLEYIAMTYGMVIFFGMMIGLVGNYMGNFKIY